jgi:hypothetical protein
MTEHATPEVFAECLQPYLFPMPETPWEAAFLLRCLDDARRRARIRREAERDTGESEASGGA